MDGQKCVILQGGLWMDKNASFSKGVSGWATMRHSAFHFYRFGENGRTNRRLSRINAIRKKDNEGRYFEEIRLKKLMIIETTDKSTVGTIY